jgi:hypothetical protein
VKGIQILNLDATTIKRMITVGTLDPDRSRLSLLLLQRETFVIAVIRQPQRWREMRLAGPLRRSGTEIVAASLTCAPIPGLGDGDLFGIALLFSLLHFMLFGMRTDSTTDIPPQSTSLSCFPTPSGFG